MGGSAIATILVLVLLGFCGFVVYFIFKILQFVIQAINLYKKMIDRLDMMIKLLNDMKPIPQAADAPKSIAVEQKVAPPTITSKAATKPVASIKQDENNTKDLTEEQLELMRQYNITYDGLKFIYQNYNYENLKDAVNYAKLAASKSKK